MSRRSRFNKKRKRRKKRSHKYDAQLPPIEVSPTLHEDSLDYLPKIIFDCDEAVSDAAREKLEKFLNFVDHRDLRQLSCIRVVHTSSIRLPSNTPTLGCYYPASRGREAEVWLSIELLKSDSTFDRIFGWIAWRDKLLETLFHEIGHHKAAHTPMISKYKDEAYAEKYMEAYKKAWIKNHAISRIERKVLRYILKCLLYYPLVFISFLFKSKSPMMKLLYLRARNQITREEYNSQLSSLLQEDSQTQKKRKWIHPLRRKKYREKFHIQER